MDYTLEFEKPVSDLEGQIKELESANQSSEVDLSGEIKALEKKAQDLIVKIYKDLTPWQRVQLSRHPNRPHASDYIRFFFEEYRHLHGDRRFGEDPSVLAGLASFKGRPVAYVGIEKGRKTQDKIHHNFGMANPEGYRKGIRIMKMAERFGLPIITFIDTPGAYPGLGAEERGQSQAIAENLLEMLSLKTPMVGVVIGEGGSGGALGLGLCDRVLMMEHSVYSVISPESCASILWSDTKMAEQAANSLQIEATSALKRGLVDEVVPEPVAGAHRNPQAAFKNLEQALDSALKALTPLKGTDLVKKRLAKYRQMGNKTLKGL